MSKKGREKGIRIKMRIYEKYSYLCMYCGCKCKVYPYEELHENTYPDDMATIEHLYPRADVRRLLAGSKQEYLRVACYKCNTKKGHIDGAALSDDPFLIEYDGLLTGLLLNNKCNA